MFWTTDELHFLFLLCLTLNNACFFPFKPSYIQVVPKLNKLAVVIFLEQLLNFYSNQMKPCLVRWRISVLVRNKENQDNGNHILTWFSWNVAYHFLSGAQAYHFLPGAQEFFSFCVNNNVINFKVSNFMHVFQMHLCIYGKWKGLFTSNSENSSRFVLFR